MDAKEEAKKLREKQKKLERFYKKLGIKSYFSQSQIDEAVIKYVKNDKFYSELVLSENQKNDADFILELCKANENYARWYNIPKHFQSNTDFVFKVLEIKVKNDPIKEDSLSSFHYHSLIKGLELRKDPEFLQKFVEFFSKVNLLGIIYELSKENFWDREAREEYVKMVSQLPRSVLVSQARKFGSKTVRMIPKDNPYFLDALSAGIERDGFESLKHLPMEKIYENRDLIAVTANCYEDKKQAMEELSEYFTQSLSPSRWDGDWHYLDVKYHPLRKALIEDDVLFDSIKLPKYQLDALRGEISEETERFYDSVRPYKERTENNTAKQGQGIGTVINESLFGEKATSETEGNIGEAFDKIAVSAKSDEGKTGK